MEGSAVTNTLAGVLEAIGTVLTSMFGWIGQVFTAVTTNPILFILVMGTFGLVAISIVRRLTRL